MSHYLRSLAQVSTAGQVGLLGRAFRKPTANVLYSFTLYERTDTANRVRVQTDSTDQPFDINEGSKLELGSTAKLRVMADFRNHLRIHEKYFKNMVLNWNHHYRTWDHATLGD